MSYVKTTGKNIGSCLTGFGIHFPVKVFNGGNEPVSYAIENSNDTNFNISKNSFVVNQNSFDIFDIFYRPTITSSVGDEITDLTITSTSIEDGSLDPSGVITLNITGERILDITGGNPRSFRVVSNFDPVSYDFYWKPPTGITGDNLHNYFITGYTLQISTDSSFSPPVAYSTQIGISENTNQNPKFSKYYGPGDEDINYKVTKNQFTDLQTGIDYYARIHTYFNNNSGVSVFASGVLSAADSVSEEVFSGYSGTPINIKIIKKAFDFTIDTEKSDDSYNLFDKLKFANNKSDNFNSFSGINIYFPENGIFNSKDPTKGAIELNGIFQNFTGVPGSDTYINFYIPSTVKINGARGFGSDFTIKESANKNIYPIGTPVTTSNFDKDFNNIISNVTDSTNGGPAFNLKLQTNINSSLLKDVKYNFFSQSRSSANSINFWEHIVSGSGGSKGGLVYSKNTNPSGGSSSQAYLFSLSRGSRSFSMFIMTALRGSLPLNFFTSRFSFDDYYVARFIVGLFYRWQTDTDPAKTFETNLDANTVILSPTMGFGEIGSANFTVKTDISQFYLQKDQYIGDKKRVTLNAPLNDVQNIDKSLFFYPFDTVRNNRLPGKIIQSFDKNVSLKFDLYNNVLPSGYIFRFAQTGINSGALWTGVSGAVTPIIPCDFSGSGGTYIDNYQSLGSSLYKAINLKNNQSLDLTFTTSVTCNSLNLFFVCSFDNIDDAYDSTVGISGTFSQTGTTITLTATKHGLTAGQYIDISFTKAAGGTVPANNTYMVVSVPTANTFTVTSAVSANIAGPLPFNASNLISLFNWVKTTGTNLAKAPRQFFIKDEDSINPRIPFRQYTKEKLNFVFFNNFLKTALPWNKDYPTLSSPTTNNVKVSKQLYSLLSISSVNTTTNVITTTTNHNLLVGDTIGFVGDSLPSQISLYDVSTPYTKQIYYVKTVPAASTLQISSSIGGTAINLTGLTSSAIIHKVSSASLYRPFILEIKRDATQDIFYINRIEVYRQPVNTSIEVAGTFITDLKDTKLSLINTGKIGINYFDCTCYNRLLNDSESNQIYSFFTKTYLSLFAGKPQSTDVDLQDDLYDFRLPNIFCIAGRT
jgi:hypothetical protein